MAPEGLLVSPLFWPSFTVVFLALLLVGEWRWRPLVYLAKPLASLGFVASALALGATGTSYGRWVLLALVLGALGDVLLIFRARGAFLAGLFTFLGSHVAYALAFFVRGISLGWLAAALPIVLWLARFLGWPLVERAPDSLRLPARAYLVVISLMVVLAAGTPPRAGWWIVSAAVAFYFSDLAVARQRFLETGFVDRLWGLPLYYGAQLVFASTVG